MKNLTVGKIITTIISIVIYLNFFIYNFIYENSPYSTPFPEANTWTTFTGISMPIMTIILLGLLLNYIIDNWNTKIFK